MGTTHDLIEPDQINKIWALLDKHLAVGKENDSLQRSYWFDAMRNLDEIEFFGLYKGVGVTLSIYTEESGDGIGLAQLDLPDEGLTALLRRLTVEIVEILDPDRESVTVTVGPLSRPSSLAG
jgi:hypothetical protein